MLHKFTLRQLLNSPEWAEIRATYHCERNPELWAVSVLMILLDNGRFVREESYRNLIISTIYSQFWRLEEINQARMPIERKTADETASPLYLPEDLVQRLNLVPQNHQRLQMQRTSPIADVSIAFERAREFLSILKDPQTKHLPEPFAQISPNALRQFLSLDNVRRTGWTRTIAAFAPDCETADTVESVAEHSIKTAFLGICTNPADPCDSFLMGICHDHAEIIVGDIPPQQAPDRERKHRLELDAYSNLTASLDQTTNVKVLRQFFEQYMRAQTPSAHLMHIADKLDMALQALTYEERYHINLEEFLVSATSDILQSWSRWLHPD